MPTLGWDPHALWIAPDDSRRMIDGGDGGAAVTLNGGETWSSLENQPTADLLSLAVDDQEPYWIYAAQNDNSHIAMPSQTDDPSIAWMHYLPLPIGEGGHTAVKPDGSVVYAADRSKLFRFIRKTGQRPEISVWPEVEYGMGVNDVKYRFYYSLPVLLSPHDPGVLYTAAQFLFRSSDEGHSWDTISPDLTQNREEVMGPVPGGPISSNGSSLFFSSVIRTIAESPLREGELWVGTDDSSIQVTRDGGARWLDVSPPDLPEWMTITAIDVSAHQPGTVYISGGRHRVSDRTPYLYKTTDYGNTWRRITNGIGKHDYSWVIREDPVRQGLLYAGTESGAYVSFDAGESWQSLQQNLPPVLVMHMVVKDDDLVIATHGRGFWIMDNISALRRITPDVVTAEMHLFDIVPTDRRLSGGRNWTRIKSRNVAKNPPRGVVIEYYLAAEPASDMSLTIMEAGGEIIQQFSSQSDDSGSPPAEAGTNRFIWDMRYPGNQLPLSAGALPEYEYYGPPARPVALPGQYIAMLTVDGQTVEQPFEIRRNPGAAASDADLRAQFELMLAIRDRVDDVSGLVLEIRETRARIAGPVEAETALRQLDDIEGILTMWIGSEAHPMMFGPPALMQKLSRLSRAVVSADAKPTASMYAVFADLSERIDMQRERLQHIIDQELAP